MAVFDTFAASRTGEALNWLCDGYGELLKMKEVGAQDNRVKEDERKALLSKDAHNAIHKLWRV